jgi:hypothetical protein
MSHLYILDENHNHIPVDVMTWAMWFETADRQVAEDYVGHVRVSTVFLGIDHGWGGEVQLYETMVFDGYEEIQVRYPTWDEAVTGHQEVLSHVRAVDDLVMDRIRELINSAG